MSRRITCENRTANGQPCGRYLGELDGAEIKFMCPKCGQFHVMPITETITFLEVWLVEVKEHQARKVLVGTV